MLEGNQAFSVRYVRRPDDLARLDAKAKAQLCPNGETVIEGNDFDRIKVSGELIAKNPELAAAFEGGVPEVSVFWERPLDDGFVVRCKARFDYLKIRGVGDSKSISNYMGRPFGERACARSSTTATTFRPRTISKGAASCGAWSRMAWSLVTMIGVAQARCR